MPMKTIIFTLAVTIIAAPAVAQNAATRGDISTSAQVRTLRNAMESAIGSLRAELAAFKMCANRTMIYAPDNVHADDDGCVKATYRDCAIGGRTYKHGQIISNGPGRKCTGHRGGGCNNWVESGAAITQCVDGQAKSY